MLSVVASPRDRGLSVKETSSKTRRSLSLLLKSCGDRNPFRWRRAFRFSEAVSPSNVLGSLLSSSVVIKSLLSSSVVIGSLLSSSVVIGSLLSSSVVIGRASVCTVCESLSPSLAADDDGVKGDCMV